VMRDGAAKSCAQASLVFYSSLATIYHSSNIVY
jgi:hypothetical protein